MVFNRLEAAVGSAPAALAPVLGANRDGSAAADSSRSLLITVMGEFVLPADQGAWTQTIIAAMESLGVQNKATRQTLARMEKRHWLSRERVGRRTRWMLTDTFTRLLEDGADRIYQFGSEQRAWDKRWLVLATTVPERERTIRYRMSVGLNWAGFGSLGQGIWINPWVDQEAVVVDLLRSLGVEAVSFRAELGELGSGHALAQQAWDLPALRRSYEEFLALTSEILPGDLQGSDAAVALARLVHLWRRFPFLDPDLPAVLLPSDWPGPEAAAVFGRLRSALLSDARDWWAEVEAEYGA